MSGCRGTCLARIFETRGLVVHSKPFSIDDATALRVLQHLVEVRTQVRKDSGCDSDACDCTPLAAYMPDPDTGRRAKEPDWGIWRIHVLVEDIGEGSVVVGQVEARSANVPGLCEDDWWMNLGDPPKGSKSKGSGPAPQKGSSSKKR